MHQDDGNRGREDVSSHYLANSASYECAVPTHKSTHEPRLGSACRLSTSWMWSCPAHFGRASLDRRLKNSASRGEFRE